MKNGHKRFVICIPARKVLIERCIKFSMTKEECRASQNMQQSSSVGINARHTTKNNICFRAIDKEIYYFWSHPVANKIIFTFVS